MVVAEMTEDNSDLFKQSIELYDAFSSPRIIYDEKLKTYKVYIYIHHIILSLYIVISYYLNNK